jgi:hypothetical protein
MKGILISFHMSHQTPSRSLLVKSYFGSVDFMTSGEYSVNDMVHTYIYRPF